MSLLSPCKLVFQYIPASEIVEHIVQISSSDFWYYYFLCNMTMKDSRQPYQYTHFKHNQLITDSTSENVITVHLVVRTRQTTDFNRFKSRLTMGNSADSCGDFGNSYFIRNMSTMVSRLRVSMATLPLTLETIKHREYYKIFTQYYRIMYVIESDYK